MRAFCLSFCISVCVLFVGTFVASTSSRLQSSLVPWSTSITTATPSDRSACCSSLLFTDCLFVVQGEYSFFYYDIALFAAQTLIAWLCFFLLPYSKKKGVRKLMPGSLKRRFIKCVLVYCLLIDCLIVWCVVPMKRTIRPLSLHHCSPLHHTRSAGLRVVVLC